MDRSSILATRGSATQIELLYQSALDSGEEKSFAVSLQECLQDFPDDQLFLAWGYRLEIIDLQPKEVKGKEFSLLREGAQWMSAILLGIALGLFYVIISRNQVNPFPFPEPGRPSFYWLVWSPALGLAILAFLYLNEKNKRSGTHLISLAAILSVATFAALIGWSTTETKEILVAVHLPLLIWSVLGINQIAGRPRVAEQFHAFLIKSIDIVATFGIFSIAFAAFGGATIGIFAVLGIAIPETTLNSAAKFALALLPLLAIVTVYDPAIEPLGQSISSGISWIVSVLARLLIVLSLVVLAVYDLIFIPAYFERAFASREILLVYNLSIAAIVVVIFSAVPKIYERTSSTLSAALRSVYWSVILLTFFLNSYALAAVLSRTFTGGLTMNRFAVTGWNVTTLIMLAWLGISQARYNRDAWTETMRVSISQAFVPLIAWLVILMLTLSVLHR